MNPSTLPNQRIAAGVFQKLFKINKEIVEKRLGVPLPEYLDKELQW